MDVTSSSVIDLTTPLDRPSKFGQAVYPHLLCFTTHKPRTRTHSIGVQYCTVNR